MVLIQDMPAPTDCQQYPQHFGTMPALLFAEKVEDSKGKQ
jgi:hypothetical protein